MVIIEVRICISPNSSPNLSPQSSPESRVQVLHLPAVMLQPGPHTVSVPVDPALSFWDDGEETRWAFNPKPNSEDIQHSLSLISPSGSWADLAASRLWAKLHVRRQTVVGRNRACTSSVELMFWELFWTETYLAPIPERFSTGLLFRIKDFQSKMSSSMLHHEIMILVTCQHNPHHCIYCDYYVCYWYM